jgi:hypothetical protein
MGHLHDQKVLQDGSFFALLYGYVCHGCSTPAVVDAMRRLLGILCKPSLRISHCTQEQADESPHCTQEHTIHRKFIGGPAHIVFTPASYASSRHSITFPIPSQLLLNTQAIAIYLEKFIYSNEQYKTLYHDSPKYKTERANKC